MTAAPIGHAVVEHCRQLHQLVSEPHLQLLGLVAQAGRAAVLCLGLQSRARALGRFEARAVRAKRREDGCIGRVVGGSSAIVVQSCSVRLLLIRNRVCGTAGVAIISNTLGPTFEDKAASSAGEGGRGNKCRSIAIADIVTLRLRLCSEYRVLDAAALGNIVTSCHFIHGRLWWLVIDSSRRRNIFLATLCRVHC